MYIPFNTDFGPLDLSIIYKFCRQLEEIMSKPENSKLAIYHYTCVQPSKRANAALLMGAYQVLMLNRTAEEAWSYFENLPRFLFFRDASLEGSSFELHIIDCLLALAKAKNLGWYSINDFNSEAYESSSLPEHGGFNWIVPKKFLAFANPISRVNQNGLTPEQYVDIFKQLGVSAVIRLNSPDYDSSKFKRKGINHNELFFEDGSTPSHDVLNRFFNICNKEPCLAIHCQAGLGRTSTLIGAYLIKYFGFTGLEAIAWCRLCRPGSVLGPQQHFLCDYFNSLSDAPSSRVMCMTPYEKHKAEYGDIGQAARLSSHSVRSDPPTVISAKYRTKFNQLVNLDPEILKIYKKN